MIHVRWMPKVPHDVSHVRVTEEQHVFGVWAELRDDGTVEVYGYAPGTRAGTVGTHQIRPDERWGRVFFEVV